MDSSLVVIEEIVVRLCFTFPNTSNFISACDSGASAPGSSPGWGHCVVFLGKTLYSHGASLHPGV